MGLRKNEKIDEKCEEMENLKWGRATFAFDAGRQMQRSAERLCRSDKTVLSVVFYILKIMIKSDNRDSGDENCCTNSI